MTLRHIRIFLAVCENGNNTTRAARALYLAQPAVTAPWPSWRNITVCACSTVSAAACISPRPGGACGNTRCTSAACSTTWKRACAAGTNRACCA